jgi:hypothetical protein
MAATVTTSRRSKRTDNAKSASRSESVNQTELKAWFCQFMASSLRRKSKVLTSGDIGGKAKQTDVAKARKLLEAEAVKYDTKLTKRRRPVEPEAGPQGPQVGQDHLSADGEGADQGR